MAKTILIVEDNELSMKLFHDLLSTQGYKIVHAGDGMQAVTLTLSSRPDLIVLDIGLPDISGLNVIQIIRENELLAEIPILVVTAYAMKADEQRIRASGCDAYITKPMNVSYFLKLVHGFLK